MDRQTQSFMDLSAIKDLAELVADTRAAWLWSADGAKVLWANAAGAAFFSAKSISTLAGLTSLERSPARPHIARIATSGMNDRFTIERLRFYRGLRVMLLTCQCKKIELDGDDTAALIICGDKGLSTDTDPVIGFAHFVASDSTTAFVTSNGEVVETLGALDGTPEDLPLPDDQTALFGPLDLNGSFHDGVVLQASATQKLVVLDNDPHSDQIDETIGAEEAPSQFVAIAEQPDEPTAEPADEGASPEPSVDADDGLQAATLFPGDTEFSDKVKNEDDPSNDLKQEAASSENQAQSTPSPAVSDGADSLNETGAPDSVEETVNTSQTDTDVESIEQPDTEVENDTSDEPVSAQPETPSASEDPEFDKPSTDEDVLESSFTFQPRRRPVRFAWKMDINQRFTFLSDEFSDVLGPSTTDVLGLTWLEVSNKFDLDPRGVIARALDRRDTWSGKTVYWPVSREALKVPVDMAALPAFDRNRKFEGYRGFGVCRTADAQQDLNSVALSPAMAAFDQSFVSKDTDGETDSAPDDDETIASSEPSPTAVGETEDTTLEGPSTGAALDAQTSDETADTTIDDDAAAATEPVAENTVDDLKPAAPNSLAGKTIIGASAAAVVGTLAKFTSRSTGPSLGGQPSRSKVHKDISSDDAKAAENQSEMIVTAIDPSSEDELELLETDIISQPDEGDEGAQEIAATQALPSAETSTKHDKQGQLSDGDPTDMPSSEEPVQEDTGTGLHGDQDEVRDQALAVNSEEIEPVGISGTAPLDPSEIESAVKSLAKSYKTSAKAAQDLFGDDDAIQSDIAKSRSTEQVTSSTEPSEDVLNENQADDLFELETADNSDDQSDIVLVAENDDAKPELNHDATTAETLSDDEREFFEETVAFEEEDNAAESGPAASDDDQPVQPTTGQVIPLATARPRVVPVDTSGLSRPERQAFRKIAEALGARLEGDLDGFDEPDIKEEPEDELPPQVPEAGPIDPSLLDRLPIGIAIVNDREVLYGNKALLKLLGYSSITALSEAGGLEALFIDDSEDLPDADRMDGEVDEPMKVRLADGGVRCVDAHMHSVPWNDGRGLMISITERPAKPSSAEAPAPPNFFAEVRSELDGARDQIAEMDTILETATDGVLVLDQHGTIVKVNGSAEALFSANRVDMVGAPFTEYLAPESHRAAADYLDGLSRNGVASILNDGREVLGTVPSGGLIPLFMTMGRIDSSKNEAKYCAVLRDITQWKTAEEELTQAKRQAENASSQKSDFLAKISHEIRTPLNAIIGFSEVMMEERFGSIGNDRYKDYLKDIRTSGSHIMSLINDLLDLSKIEAGKLDLKFSAVSANDVINECVALMQPQANRERVIIRASLPDTVPNVVADPRSLRQIILNILSNAIKYNKSGGQVILSTALEENGEVAMRVRDTGTGMTAKQLTAALEPFRQLHTASRGGGTGLGLPLTKALVEANRAAFHIDSTPDQGTLVEISFPTQRVLSE